MTRRVALKRFRKRAGLSQAELARRSGVSQPMISRLEAGTGPAVRLDVLEQLARALSVSPRSLLGTARRR